MKPFHLFRLRNILTPTQMASSETKVLIFRWDHKLSHISPDDLLQSMDFSQFSWPLNWKPFLISLSQSLPSHQAICNQLMLFIL